jgi:hypothetical protein
MVLITAVHMEGGHAHEHIAGVKWKGPADSAPAYQRAKRWLSGSTGTTSRKLPMVAIRSTLKSIRSTGFARVQTEFGATICLRCRATSHPNQHEFPLTLIKGRGPAAVKGLPRALKNVDRWAPPDELARFGSNAGLAACRIASATADRARARAVLAVILVGFAMVAVATHLV